MNLGPLEYVVVGVTDAQDHQPLTKALLYELNSIQEKDQIRVIDLIMVKKAADGSIVMHELGELDDKENPAYSGIAEDLTGLMTKEDVEGLAALIPPASSAYVILLEHAWVTGLTEAVRAGGGVVFAGGMVPHAEALRIVSELTDKEA
jgi:hypothetical protein